MQLAGPARQRGQRRPGRRARRGCRRPGPSPRRSGFGPGRRVDPRSRCSAKVRRCRSAQPVRRQFRPWLINDANAATIGIIRRQVQHRVAELARAVPMQKYGFAGSISTGFSSSTSASSHSPSLRANQPHPEKNRRTAAWSSRARRRRDPRARSFFRKGMRQGSPPPSALPTPFGQTGERLETVDGDLMAGGNLRAQAQTAASDRADHARKVTTSGSMHQSVIARSSCDEAIQSFRVCGSGLLRCARNDGGVWITPQGRALASPWPRSCRSRPSSPSSARCRSRAVDQASACGTRSISNFTVPPVRPADFLFSQDRWSASHWRRARRRRTACRDRPAVTRIGRMPFLKQLL